MVTRKGYRNQKDSILDYIISFGSEINPKKMEIDEERLLWEESDHNLIQWEAAVFVHDEWSKKREAGKKKKWQWPQYVSQEQWGMFAAATDEIAADKIEEWAAKPIQDKYDTLIQILTQAGKEVIGGKWIIVKKRKKASPKRTDVQITISKLRKMRTKLRKKLRKSPMDQELLQKVQQLGKEIREKDIREQDQQMAQLSQDMLGKGLDQKKAFFSYVTRKRSDKSIEATMVAGDGKPIILRSSLQNSAGNFGELQRNFWGTESSTGVLQECGKSSPRS